MKRLTVPRIWTIPKKTKPWAVRARPGPHRLRRSIPLLVVIRDYLNYADNAREARHIIGGREITVDGKVVTDPKRPVGLMDVVGIPGTDENFRILLDARGKIRTVRIDKARAEWKLIRVENKTVVKGHKFQVNFHDGRNILLDENKYKTGDVLKIALPTQKVMEHYPMEEGNTAMVIGGRHATVPEVSAV
jgi:small subunit ribosomal protein S4e